MTQPNGSRRAEGVRRAHDEWRTAGYRTIPCRLAKFIDTRGVPKKRPRFPGGSWEAAENYDLDRAIREAYLDIAIVLDNAVQCDFDPHDGEQKSDVRARMEVAVTKFGLDGGICGETGRGFQVILRAPPGTWTRNTSAPEPIDEVRCGTEGGHGLLAFTWPSWHPVARCYYRLLTPRPVRPLAELPECPIALLKPVTEPAAEKRRVIVSAPREDDGSRGDWRTLDIVALFQAHGMYLRDLGNGKHGVQCPWESLHTTGGDGTDAVVFEAHATQTGFPGFQCQRGHCEHRGLADVRGFFGAATIDRHCRESFRPESRDPDPEPVTEGEEWPEPVAIPGLPAVRPFRSSMLPERLQPWIEDIAERMQCPLDYPGVASMVAVAAVVGRKVTIRPKRKDDWTVVPNLWAHVVGRPGVLKTPAVREPLKPLARLAAQARETYTAGLAEYQREKAEYEDRDAAVRSDRREKMRKALKHDAKDLDLPGLPDPPEPPTCRRYTINDATVEKLGELLAENPNGLLLFRDELIGFWRQLDKKGRENERAFYLESWDGLADFTYDRIGRGSLYIPSTTVSIFGCVTPGSLGAYLRGAEDGGSGDDGFVQRYQLAVWPDLPPTFENVDRWPKSDARQAAYELFKELDRLDPEEVGAQWDYEDGAEVGIPFLRFTEEAQARFDEWRTALELTIRELDDHPSLAAHLSKFRSLIPTLALLWHLGSGGTGNVTRAALEAALTWDTYLRSHAERIFASATGTDPRYVLERKALARLLALAPEDRTTRSLFQWAKRWRGIIEVDDLEAVLRGLEKRHLIRIESAPRSGKAGRPASDRIIVSPLADAYSIGPHNPHNTPSDSSQGDSEDYEDHASVMSRKFADIGARAFGGSIWRSRSRRKAERCHCSAA